MTLSLRKTAWLAGGLVLVSAGLLALAAARGFIPERVFAPGLDAGIGKLRAAQAENAAAALRRQGGSRILLALDSDALREAMMTGLRDDARRLLREARIPLAGFAARDGSVEVRLRDAADRERTLQALARLEADGIQIAASGELIRLTPTQPGFAERLHTLRQHSIALIEQRLGGLGITASAVQPDGSDRIRVLLPGVDDPGRLGAILDKRSRVTFRLVDPSMTAEAALHQPPAGSEVVYERDSKVPYLLLREVALDGSDIADAAPAFDQRTNEPIVSFRFNAAGTRRFSRITQENIGRPFAVVLDGEVIAAPVIREPILGGSGQVSGSFTLEEANRIALLMRSGALPGHLVVVEQQVVAPGAGPGNE